MAFQQLTVAIITGTKMTAWLLHLKGKDWLDDYLIPQETTR